jgi:hypothetical protein
LKRAPQQNVKQSQKKKNAVIADRVKLETSHCCWVLLAEETNISSNVLSGGTGQSTLMHITVASMMNSRERQSCAA